MACDWMLAGFTLGSYNLICSNGQPYTYMDNPTHILKTIRINQSMLVDESRLVDDLRSDIIVLVTISLCFLSEVILWVVRVFLKITREPIERIFARTCA